MVDFSEELKRRGITSQMLETISQSLRKAPARIYECRKCSKKFCIPGAREGKLYRCVSCSLVMSECGSGSIVESGGGEVVLDEALPPDVLEAAIDASKVFGRYVLLAELVKDCFKAFDLELSRCVALQFISEQSAMHANIRSLASLEHKNIAHIYDVGFISGRGYAARQFVEGKVIADCRLEIDELLSVMAAVCEAIDYAGKKGIKHGDVNALNVLIDSENHPVIVNFGLVDSGKDDACGIALTMNRVLTNSVAAAEVPPEVVAIINKGLKNQEARDADCAAEMARDIRDYLAGMPVRAYSRSPIYRLGKFIARHRLATSVAILLFVVLFLAGKFAYARYQESKQEESRRKTTEELEKQAKEKELQAEGDARRKKQESDRLVKALLKDISGAHNEAIERRRTGEKYARLAEIAIRLSQSPAYKNVREIADKDASVLYSFGRLYRIIGDLDTAELYFKRAIDADVNHALSHFELGFICYLGFSTAVRHAFETWAAMQAPGKRKHLVTPEQLKTEFLQNFETPYARKYRESAKVHFQKCIPALEPESLERLLAEGIMFAIDSKYEESREKYEKAYKINPGADEAFYLLSGYYKSIGQIGKAIEILSGAIEVDKGNTTALLLRADAHFDLSGSDELGNRSIESELQLAIDDCNRLLELHPDIYDGYMRRGMILNTFGQIAVSRGKDATEFFLKAVKDFDTAAPHRPDKIDALEWKGAVYSNLGEFTQRTGGNSLQYIEAGIAALEAALKIEPGNGVTLLWCGIAHMNRGICNKNKGIDPTDDYERAEKLIAKSIEADPVHSEAWLNRGRLWYNSGNWTAQKGGDLSDDYERAEGYYIEALKHDKTNVNTVIALANVYAGWARFKNSRNEDPEELFGKCEVELNAAKSLDPGSYEVYETEGRLYFEKGDYEERIKEDPADDWIKGAEAYEKAIQLSSIDFDLRMSAGMLYMHLANRLDQIREDPAETAAKGIEHYEAAARLAHNDQDRSRALVGAAGIHVNMALRMQRHFEDPSKEYDAAEKNLTTALELYPDNSIALEFRGNMFYNKGMYLRNSKKFSDAADLFLKCADDFERAGKLNPRLGERLLPQVKNIRAMAEELKKADKDY